MFKPEEINRLPLGIQGENGATVVKIDVSEWLAEFPNATINLMARRPTETVPYIALTVVVNGVLYWVVSQSDTTYDGIGRAELRATENGTVKKSLTFTTDIRPSIEGVPSPLPPEPAQSWVDTVIEKADEIFNTRVESFENVGGHLIATLGDGTTEDLGYINGDDGISPEIEITSITSGHRVNITDAEHPSGQAFDVYNGLNETLESENVRLRVIACGITKTENGWEIISEGAHTPLGISSVSVDNNGRILFTYNFTGRKVVTFIASTDETYAGLYRLGASVDKSYALINVWSLPRMIGGYVEYDAVNGEFDFSATTGINNVKWNANGLVDVEYANYPDLSSADISMLNVIPRSPHNENITVRVINNNSSKMQIAFFDDGALISGTPSEKIRFYVQKFIPARRINANDVMPGGNFIVLGLMEVDEIADGVQERLEALL